MRKFLYWVGLGIALCSSLAMTVPLQVPIGNQWTVPQRIPGYDNDADTPYLIADQNQTIHAFNSVRMGRDLVIVYSQWTQANGWTAPVDILLSPLKNIARIMGAFLDDQGMVHVVFYGGDELGAAIFYSKAPLSQAGRAPAWSPIQLVGEDPTSPGTVVFTGDGDGNLFIVYGGTRDGVGMYAVYSSNGGDTWGEPVVVSLVNDDVHLPANMSYNLDAQGRLHIVWTLVNEGGNGDALYYARLDADHKQWSDPFVLATRAEADYETDWGSIFSYKDLLIVVYDDSTPATRWMRISDDGGKTWSDPIRPFTFVGEYGHAVFVEDSGNNLHMFLGNRTQDNPPIHGMWHSMWLGNRWSELTPVVSGPSISSGPLIQRFDPTWPRAVVSQGNLLFIVWKTDGMAGRNGIWYAYTTLNTPEMPVKPLPTPQPTATSVPTPGFISNLPVATALPSSFQRNNLASPPTIQSPSLSLVAAAIPSVLLISIVIAWYKNRFRSRGAHTKN